jgi:hypothetical protein
MDIRACGEAWLIRVHKRLARNEKRTTNHVQTADEKWAIVDIFDVDQFTSVAGRHGAFANIELKHSVS